MVADPDVMLNSSHLRRRSVAVAFALFAATPVSASALPHQIDPAASRSASRSPAQAERGLERAAIEAYQRRFKTSEGVARKHLVLQSIPVDLPGALSDRIGDELSAVRFDNARGEWVVSTTGSVSDDRISQLMVELGLEQAYRVEKGRWSAGRLEAETRRIHADVPAELGRKVSPAVVGASVEVRISDDLSEEDRSRVKRLIEPDTPVNIAVVPRETTDVRPTIACTFPYCDTLLGGTKAWMNGGSCSTGFYVGRQNDSYTYLLTAGHCIVNGAAWSSCKPSSSNCPTAGNQTMGYFGSGGDRGLLRITASISTWPAYGGYVSWSTGGVSPLRSYETVNTAVGTMVCRHGATSGTQCGPVNASSACYGPPNEPCGMVSAQACSRAGDSGGAVARAYTETAVGITSGGSNASAPYCNISTDTFSYEPIQRAVTAYNAIVFGG